MSSNETKIAPCPYCGETPDQYSDLTQDIIHNTSSCCLAGKWFILKDWNALCADIEKGRRYDEVNSKCIEATANRCLYRLQREEAVRLLGKTDEFNILMPSQKKVDWMRGVDDLLDKPWVKAILEQGEK